jgi:glutaminyl-peptide cyclotransferase
MSDGTEFIRILDPATFREMARIRVSDGPKSVDRLNELEFVEGELWANVFMTNKIVRIEPRTGRVSGWIDVAGLLSADEYSKADVLNGIAYDRAQKRLFVTGKYWPKLFHIRVVPAVH